MTPCIMVYSYQRFEEAFCLNLQGTCTTLKISAASSPETLVPMCQYLGVISQRSQSWNVEWFIQYNVIFRWKLSKLRHFIITVGFCNEMPGESQPLTFHLGILTLRGGVRFHLSEKWRFSYWVLSRDYAQSYPSFTISDIVTGRNCPLAIYPLYCVGLCIPWLNQPNWGSNRWCSVSKMNSHTAN